MAAAVDKDKVSHKIIIQKNLVYLTSNTGNLSNLLINLLGTFTLTFDEVERIQSCRTSLEKYMELYTQICRRDEKAFKHLCKALEDSNNHNVLSILTSSSALELEESDPSEDLLSGANITGPMMMKLYQRRNIFRYFDFITKNTRNLMSILIHLQQEDVLTSDEHAKILSWRTDECRNGALYINLINKKPNPFVRLIKVLRVTDNGDIADMLEHVPEEDEDFETEITNIRMAISRIRIDEEKFVMVTISDSIRFGIRGELPKEKFIGREDILKSLERSIKSQAEEAKKSNHSKITVLCGLPGVGKSETVRQYVNIYHKDDNVIWINAENVRSMVHSFRQLAREYLNIDVKEADGEDRDIRLIVRAVYEMFSEKRCVFVFDNAENKEDASRHENSIDRFLPVIHPAHIRPLVIVTSQNTYWPSPTQTWEKIKIDVFTKNESDSFIKKNLKIEISNDEVDSDVDNLSVAMQGHPLALTQAVEYISRENANQRNDGSTYKISDFLLDFKEKEKEVLKYQAYGRCASEDNPHLSTVFATWKLSVEGIRKTEDSGEKAIEILYTMAYYDSYGIRSKLFHPFSDRTKLGMLLGILKRYSLISCSDGVIDIHGLLQQVTRLDLEENKRDEEVLERSMELLDRFMPKDSLSFFKGDEIALPHANVAWDYAINYPKLVCRYHDDLGITITENMRNGCYSRASRFSKDAIIHMSKVFGETDDQVMKMRTVNLLPNIRTGDHESVSKQMQIIMSVVRERLGQNIPPKDQVEAIAFDYLRKYSTFISTGGNMEELRGPVQEAMEKMSEQIFQDKEKDDEDKFFTTLPFQMTQAGLLHQSGSHAEAFKILKNVEQGLVKLSGENNQLVLTIRKTIAGVMSSMGNNDEALKLMEDIKAIENSKENPPEPIPGQIREFVKIFHNDDESIYNQIHADILEKAGRHDEALIVLGYKEKSKEKPTTSKTNTFVNADILANNTFIAKNLISQGKYTEGLSIAEENYSISLKQFGMTNGTTISLLSMFIWALDRLKRFDEALDKCQLLYDSLSRTFGDENEITQSILLMIPDLIEKRDKQRENESNLSPI